MLINAVRVVIFGQSFVLIGWPIMEDSWIWVRAYFIFFKHSIESVETTVVYLQCFGVFYGEGLQFVNPKDKSTFLNGSALILILI